MPAILAQIALSPVILLRHRFCSHTRPALNFDFGLSFDLLVKPRCCRSCAVMVKSLPEFSFLKVSHCFLAVRNVLGPEIVPIVADESVVCASSITQSQQDCEVNEKVADPVRSLGWRRGRRCDSCAPSAGWWQRSRRGGRIGRIRGFHFCRWWRWCLWDISYRNGRCIYRI